MVYAFDPDNSSANAYIIPVASDGAVPYMVDLGALSDQTSFRPHLEDDPVQQADIDRRFGCITNKLWFSGQVNVSGDVTDEVVEVTMKTDTYTVGVTRRSPGTSLTKPALTFYDEPANVGSNTYEGATDGVFIVTDLGDDAGLPWLLFEDSSDGQGSIIVYSADLELINNASLATEDSRVRDIFSMTPNRILVAYNQANEGQLIEYHFSPESGTAPIAIFNGNQAPRDDWIDVGAEQSLTGGIWFVTADDKLAKFDNTFTVKYEPLGASLAQNPYVGKVLHETGVMIVTQVFVVSTETNRDVVKAYTPNSQGTSFDITDITTSPPTSSTPNYHAVASALLSGTPDTVFVMVQNVDYWDTNGVDKTLYKVTLGSLPAVEAIGSAINAAPVLAATSTHLYYPGGTYTSNALGGSPKHRGLRKYSYSAENADSLVMLSPDG